MPNVIQINHKHKMYNSYTTSSSVIPIEVLFCKIVKQTLTRKVVLNKI